MIQLMSISAPGNGDPIPPKDGEFDDFQDNLIDESTTNVVATGEVAFTTPPPDGTQLYRPTA